MHLPAYANLLTHFYPIGNTPAVCLTQNLLPEKQATILLLGCGDVRNILFTAHCDGRPMDITCCDIEKAVIARNVLLLSLIIDDSKAQQNEQNWNIYYHLYIDKTCQEKVRLQAVKLHGLSSSMRIWRDGPYGKLVRFCDDESLREVAEVWKFYLEESREEEQPGFDKAAKAAINRRNERREGMGGKKGAVVLTGLRSAAPASIAAPIELSQLHEHFWQHGSTDLNHELTSQAICANPMLLSPNSVALLHYGTDPLLGFHLSPAFSPIAQGPLKATKTTEKSKAQSVVAVARKEFCIWSDSFRQRAPDRFTLRLFRGDALAFSHALQCRQTGRSNPLGACYRAPYSMTPLALNEEDFGPHGSAPLTFTVIDTSNLIDHVGALNLLVATSSLLARDVAASLYTEVLPSRGESDQELVDDLLCGHLSTISLLLGLFPVDYWTNTTPSSSNDERMLDILTRMKFGGPMPEGRQSFNRITWKREPDSSLPTMQQLHMDESSLAQILFHVYIQLFPNENLSALLSNPKKIGSISLPLHHRRGFAAFLQSVQSRVAVNWEKLMGELLDEIGNDTRLLTGRNSIQELFLHMHLLGVYSVETLQKSYNIGLLYETTSSLLGWKNMPSIVSVTLKVPRDKLAVFTDKDAREVGTVPVQCSVQHSPKSKSRPWQNTFVALQLCFGQISTSGNRYSGSFEVHVVEDPLGWKGESPLLVSFMAPTWMLLLEPQAAVIAFGIQSTPITSVKFGPRLGAQMDVFQTTITDIEHIYISKDLPNQPGVISGSRFVEEDTTLLEAENIGVKTTITASFDTTRGRISSITGRLDFVDQKFKSALLGGFPVNTISLSPCTFVVSIGELNLRLSFPIPVVASNRKVRIARKSAFVELIVLSVSTPARTPSSNFTYPVLLDGGIPTAWNMPYLSFSTLPIIDTSEHDKLSWLNPHISMMFSEEERRLREDDSLPCSVEERARVDFKDSLFTIFIHFTGLQGQRSRVFGLNNETNGGVHILLFVSSLRLDLANRTIVLDAAVLSLHNKLMPQIRPFLSSLTDHGIFSINVNDVEMCLWKKILPAYVERCRSWEHQTSCEYRRADRVPLSVENGQMALCTCGNGFLPPDFDFSIAGWSAASKHAVRAAISPSFCCSLADTMFTGQKKSPENKRCATCCKEPFTDGTSLQWCSGCHLVQYCSQRCQRSDWKAHKGKCAGR